MNSGLWCVHLHIITINGQPHKVRIIDTQHDTISIGELAGETATLTFEMETLLCDTGGEVLSTIWDPADNYDYTNSEFMVFTLILWCWPCFLWIYGVHFEIFHLL